MPANKYNIGDHVRIVEDNIYWNGTEGIIEEYQNNRQYYGIRISKAPPHNGYGVGALVGWSDHDLIRIDNELTREKLEESYEI